MYQTRSIHGKIKKKFLKKHYEKGMSSNVLAREYNIPRSTIKNWFAKTNKGIDVLVDRRPHGSGRIPETKAGYKERYEILKKNGKIPDGTTREKAIFINSYRDK